MIKIKVADLPKEEISSLSLTVLNGVTEKCKSQMNKVKTYSTIEPKSCTLTPNADETKYKIDCSMHIEHNEQQIIRTVDSLCINPQIRRTTSRNCYRSIYAPWKNLEYQDSGKYTIEMNDSDSVLSDTDGIQNICPDPKVAHFDIRFFTYRSNGTSCIFLPLSGVPSVSNLFIIFLF